MSSSLIHSRSHWRMIVRCAAALLIGVCVWQAAASRPSTSIGSAEIEVRTAGIGVSRPGETRQLRTTPIREIRPGMRVLADNPELSGSSTPDSEIDATWRLVTLEMTKPNGVKLTIELLRPRDWLLALAVDLVLAADQPDDLFQDRKLSIGAEDQFLGIVLLGRPIELDLSELGARGPATVVSIAPCPQIERPTTPGRRVVTGTFRHSAGTVFELHVECGDKPLSVTPEHPFWSADRQQFVPVSDLRPGERLQRADGEFAIVSRIHPTRGPPVEVFNLEVDIDHVYHVGLKGILVHNNYFYESYFPNEMVEYVGITNDIVRRGKEHSKIRKIFDIPGMVGLSRPDAHAVEQALIVHYGLSKHGGLLSNIRNSVSPTNSNYSNILAAGRKLLHDKG